MGHLLGLGEGSPERGLLYRAVSYFLCLPSRHVCPRAQVSLSEDNKHLAPGALEHLLARKILLFQLGGFRSSYRVEPCREHLQARLGHSSCTHPGFLVQSPLNILPRRGCQVALTEFFKKKESHNLNLIMRKQSDTSRIGGALQASGLNFLQC